eukprot:366162-Chlamydomonas_euryale.AAC.5
MREGESGRLGERAKRSVAASMPRRRAALGLGWELCFSPRRWSPPESRRAAHSRDRAVTDRSLSAALSD